MGMIEASRKQALQRIYKEFWSTSGVKILGESVVLDTLPANCQEELQVAQIVDCLQCYVFLGYRPSSILS